MRPLPGCGSGVGSGSGVGVGSGVVTTTAKILSVYDIVNAKQLVIDKAALAIIEEVYA